MGIDDIWVWMKGGRGSAAQLALILVLSCLKPTQKELPMLAQMWLEEHMGVWCQSLTVMKLGHLPDLAFCIPCFQEHCRVTSAWHRQLRTQNPRSLSSLIQSSPYQLLWSPSRMDHAYPKFGSEVKVDDARQTYEKFCWSHNDTLWEEQERLARGQKWKGATGKKRTTGLGLYCDYGMGLG